jgi:demethylmenaquinone methyltransferase / 2-methoxy-6-polyprenyl-1,4-benzoquinol methylase
MGKLPNKEEKERYVQEMFNKIAKRYDLMNTLMTFGLDKGWREFTVKHSELKPGGNALDVCCGTGMLSMELAKVGGSNGKVTGLDFSEEMLIKGRENIKEFSQAKNINLIQGNAMELPFADNTFDCATVGWGLRNVPDIKKAVSEMMRVVKPGGKVVSLDMAKPSMPVFKQIYWLYFDKIVPFMGKVTAGKKSAYSYLHDSAREFPHQKDLAKLFGEVGLSETKYFDLAGGVVAVVEGRKPL